MNSFVTKELDIYAFALKKLLSPEVAKARLSFMEDEKKRKKVIEMLNNVSIEFCEL